MIPGVFEYHRPSTLTEAAGLLTRFGDEARVLAGGHSLIPMMKLRMANPEHLVDLQDVGELKGISISGGEISIGAMVTQHELIDDKALATAVPIIREAALQIADPQVRYVGTIGGNVANGDPGNDMPGLMQCLNATYEVAGEKGTRRIAAREFYEGAYFTALADDEILSRVIFPKPDAGTGYAYEKQKRKIGDYATAAAAVMIGKAGASIAMTNLGDTPVWSTEANDALTNGDVEGAVNAAMAAINPASDNRGPAEFKKHLAGVVLRRAIERAQSRAS
ncbi:xanthine dehydrogenase family protein subunit M [Rhizobiales bacterium]|uniref:FAD binding domain-containing protein n=1 Tax=Hongsoonwoonella zoysiae TaxID=2821844 RepID=UPI00155F96DC|nr:xanthine dehydrogenase family protein subunit M [Hongsoonwoonella zoysiae]NRG18723.1 xanthine dehydrogenase family protein subunit M [Hongsoonwoonella zoysiae]